MNSALVIKTLSSSLRAIKDQKRSRNEIGSKKFDNAHKVLTQSMTCMRAQLSLVCSGVPLSATYFVADFNRFGSCMKQILIKAAAA
jgi:hypothetical protein